MNRSFKLVLTIEDDYKQLLTLNNDCHLAMENECISCILPPKALYVDEYQLKKSNVLSV